MTEKKLPVAITHPDRVLFPGDGYTKRDLADFYNRVFPRLKPWVDGRLLSLERCPQGIRGQCFYQKEAPAGLPPKTPTKAIRHASGVTRYVVGGRRETQLALANFGCIAVHVWGSRAAAPRKPDWLCFDLDPGRGGFASAVRAALEIRDALATLRLTSYAKTSGGKGLHVFVPLRPGPDADEVLAFTRAVGRILAEARPETLTDEVRIAKRRGRRRPRSCPQRFRADGRHALLRPRPAPRSCLTPLDWSEVRPPSTRSRFTSAISRSAWRPAIRGPGSGGGVRRCRACRSGIGLGRHRGAVC